MAKTFLLFVLALSFCLPANALLRRHRTPSVKAHPESSPSFVTEYKLANFHAVPKIRVHRPTDEDRYYSSIEGVVAFTSTFLSLACFLALSITSVQFFIIPALAFATLATILGAVGIKRMKPGYAIVGLIVGLIELVAGFAVLANLPPL